MRNHLALWLVTLGLWSCSRLPLETARSLGRWLGVRYWAMDTRGRRVVERNIALAYPQLSRAEQGQMALETLQETGCACVRNGPCLASPLERNSIINRRGRGR